MCVIPTINTFKYNCLHERRISMEGMSTQDILNGQDLSTANVDDLLAAMGANEAAQG